MPLPLRVNLNYGCSLTVFTSRLMQSYQSFAAIFLCTEHALVQGCWPQIWTLWLHVLFQFGIRQDKTGHWFWIKNVERKTYRGPLDYANFTTAIFTNAIFQNILEIFCLCIYCFSLAFPRTKHVGSLGSRPLKGKPKGDPPITRFLLMQILLTKFLCFVSVWYSPGQDRSLVLDQDCWGKNLLR